MTEPRQLKGVNALDVGESKQSVASESDAEKGVKMILDDLHSGN